MTDAPLFNAVEPRGIIGGGGQPLLIAGELVEIPERTGKETAGPVFRPGRDNLSINEGAGDFGVVFEAGEQTSVLLGANWKLAGIVRNNSSGAAAAEAAGAVNKSVAKVNAANSRPVKGL